MVRFNGFNSSVSKVMNSNFRVRLGKEFGYKLVAYSGLCLLLGCEVANHLILKLHSTMTCDKKAFYKPQIGTTVTFYLK